MIASQRGILLALKRSSNELKTLSERLTAAGHSVTSGSQTIAKHATESAGAVSDMGKSLAGVDQSVGTLRQAADSGQISITTMARANAEVATKVATMAEAVAESSGAIEEVASSVTETARHVESLEAALRQTSVSMHQIETAIVDVEGHTERTAGLSGETARNAEVGAQAVAETLQGIERIRQTSDAVKGAIDHLAESIEDIGEIVSVIDGIAERTNLLSLNAAIIAAQAGEQGKGFGVVADEVKNLANRTRTATDEIAALIRKIQDESRKALDAVGLGMTSVRDGLEVGRRADNLEHGAGHRRCHPATGSGDQRGEQLRATDRCECPADQTGVFGAGHRGNAHGGRRRAHASAYRRGARRQPSASR